MPDVRASALAAVCLLPAVIYDFTVTALRLYASRRSLIFAIWVVFPFYPGK
mgnify:CR=1 FL=1